ncbi:hypothetical protein [Acinetobacter indicus]|uniref:hypothetical protein n=1 Tax=Acinetobacter indicus TaxID=756892 RepID=UPI000CEBB140|nr:hypothetical protein [Acinetobacter indicus]MCO8100976.1 hypothetical protein [Acinetobacter indicus]MCO8106561.1 hypothetical protein [Acinetobacter indicus]MCO8112254.1 hypothetical protein [Acinetobacter indicus]
MTIIVCGYTHKVEQKIDFAKIANEIENERWEFKDGKIIDAYGNELDDIPPRKKYERPELNHQNYELVLDSFYKSTFYLCDSGISVGDNLAYIDNYLKVDTIDLKIYEPSFQGYYFHSYQSIKFERKVAIAFAGNVNLAKLCISYIKDHLEKLRISRSDARPIEYIVRKHCDKDNPLYNNPESTMWDKDLFVDYNERNLYTANQISEFVEHSINAGYERIRKNLSNLKANTAIREKDIIAEFAVTIYCPSKNKNEIYVYRPKFIENEFGVPNGKLIAEKHLLPEDQIAILGTKAITQDLEQQYSNLLTDIKNPQEELFKSVNQYIKNQISECIFNVNLPSYYFQFDQYKGLTIIKRLKE